MKLPLQFLRNHPKATILSTGLIFLLLILVASCKDDGSSHLAGEVQSCKDYFNSGAWSDAIETCEDAGTDETLHFAAQAYMARSGASLFSIMLALTEDSAAASKIMFDKIPNTAAKKSDYNRALSIIMDKISVKNGDMYLESLILSGLLIFDQLKSLLTLEWDATNDQFLTCADSSSCSFAPDATFDGVNKLLFTGLGASFYNSICGDSSSDTYNSNVGDVFRDGQVFGCTIQSGSLLKYNQLAVDEYYAVGVTEIEDAMVPFKFYKNMDQGGNFSEFVGAPLNTTVFFCDNAGITYLSPEPTSDDFKLNDCEILEYLKNPGF
jgi:hypothetical protein